LLALILIASPVAGLRPMRAARFLTCQMSSPAIRTRSPLQMLGHQSDKVVEEFAPRPFCQLVLLAKLTATWSSVIVTWSAIFFPRDAHGPHPAGAVDEEGTRPHHRSRYGHVGPATLCQSATLLGPPCTGLR